MAMTTYGTNTTTTTRSNNSVYWAIGIALIVAIIAFFAWRERPVTVESAPVERSTTLPAEEPQTAPATPATPE